jgi:hypothetical protein
LGKKRLGLFIGFQAWLLSSSTAAFHKLQSFDASSFIHLAPMRDPGDTNKLRAIVNDVQNPPVTYTNAPKISVAF